MTAEGRGRIAESKTAESEANGKADFFQPLEKSCRPPVPED
jgi:hypothetical protein